MFQLITAFPFYLSVMLLLRLSFGVCLGHSCLCNAPPNQFIHLRLSGVNLPSLSILDIRHRSTSSQRYSNNKPNGGFSLICLIGNSARFFPLPR